MKNLNATRNAQIDFNLPVPVGTISGTPIRLGANGLIGLPISARATAATIADGTSAPGLADGEASVELIGVHTSVNLTVIGAATQFAIVYVDNATGAVTFTAAGGTKIGYWLDGAGASPTGRVALIN